MANKKYSSGENAEFSNLELDPDTGQISTIAPELSSYALDVKAPEIFAEPEPASMLTADRLLQDIVPFSLSNNISTSQACKHHHNGHHK